MKRPEDMSREELEEEVAFLRSELGQSCSDTELLELQKGTGLRPGETQVLMALHRAKGRLVSHAALFEAAPAKWAGEDRNPEIVKVYISKIRSALGPNTIETGHGRGYRLTDEGQRAVGWALARRAA